MTTDATLSHTGSDRLLFLNLPVRDVTASRSFFTGLGFSFDDRFCDETTACLKVSEAAYVMLLEHPRFADFTAKPLADPATSTAALVCLSAADRDAVDTLTESALARGARPAKEPMDLGFMYGRSFYDLDGHHWEVMWMSQAAVDQAGADSAARVGADA